MEKVVTIVDVASKANVSVGTVSRVFNAHANVNSKLKEKVLKTAADLGYKLKAQANGGKAVFSGNFGIILEEHLGEDSSWTQKIVFDVVQALSQFGHHCQLLFLDNKDDIPPQVVRRMDGCIIWGGFSDQFYDNLENICSIPVVSYSKEIPYQNGVAIEVYNKESMSQAVEHLVALGHKRISLITNSEPVKTVEDRLEGFRETLHRCAIEVDENLIRCIPGLNTADSCCNGAADDENDQIFENVKELMALKNAPSAFIFGSDLIALSGMESLKDIGYRIPADVSVLGFDNLFVGRYPHPKLTTMGLDTRELATTMIDALEKLIVGRNVEKKTMLNRRLVRRQSTGRYVKK